MFKARTSSSLSRAEVSLQNLRDHQGPAPAPATHLTPPRVLTAFYTRHLGLAHKFKNRGQNGKKTTQNCFVSEDYTSDSDETITHGVKKVFTFILKPSMKNQLGQNELRSIHDHVQMESFN